MKVKELADKYKVLNMENGEREITDVFCCDLLSIAMGKAPSDSVWVTVMANINTLAVASLTDVACVILAENATLDEATLAKAKEQEINVFKSEEPIFKTAYEIYNTLK